MPCIGEDGGMVFELDVTLNPEVAPLAWLVGSWRGLGVVGYPGMESCNMVQEVEITHDGRPFLTMNSRSWELDEEGKQVRPLATETGYWRVVGDGEIELLLAHPTGIVEMFVGKKEKERPVIEIATDGVMRSPAAREYNSAKRMYGLVDSKLMWVLEMAADGHPMTSHMSAQLERVA
ncbi:Domain of uncharacterised function (DUF1794) [Dermatophilus congolensis]|uniref:Peroxynitrite isomerase n=2 Tax=Dermatophilus congolensis TaxID=1863 RepID=A0AA46BLH1_9MICO|nr:Domain of uncharacterised function (DUF1794) [Dermatophilus congolensis]